MTTLNCQALLALQVLCPLSFTVMERHRFYYQIKLTQGNEQLGHEDYVSCLSFWSSHFGAISSWRTIQTSNEKRKKNTHVVEGAKYSKAAENPSLPFPPVPMPPALTDRPVLSTKTWKKKEQLFLTWCHSPNNFPSNSGFTRSPYFCLTFDFWAFFVSLKEKEGCQWRRQLVFLPFLLQNLTEYVFPTCRGLTSAGN